MAIQISPESPYGRELERWTRQAEAASPFSLPNNPIYDGHRARPGQRFPMMVYRTQVTHSGQTRSVLPQPNPRHYRNGDEQRLAFERDSLMVDDHNRRCWKIVQSDDELERAEREGYRMSPVEALKHHEALQQDIARAAAESAEVARTMSPKAQRERKAREDAQPGVHVTD